MEKEPERSAREDQVLLHAIGHACDRGAFREFWCRHEGFVYRLALRLLRNEVWAEDAAQESALEIWHAARTFQPSHLVRPWLARIVARRAFRLRAKEVRYQREGKAMPPEEGHPAFCAPEERAAEREVQAALLRFLKELPERQEQSLTLYYTGGLSEKEIGALMGISQPAVAKLLKGGLERLRVRLAQAGHTTLGVAALTKVISETIFSHGEPVPPGLHSKVLECFSSEGASVSGKAVKGALTSSHRLPGYRPVTGFRTWKWALNIGAGLLFAWLCWSAWNGGLGQKELPVKSAGRTLSNSAPAEQTATIAPWRLVGVRGNAHWRSPGTDGGLALARPDELWKEGRAISTGQEAEVELRGPGGLTILLRENSRLARGLTGAEGAECLEMAVGALAVELPTGTRPLTWRTPHGRLETAGAKFFLMMTEHYTRADVLTGRARFQQMPNGPVLELAAGQAAAAGKDLDGKQIEPRTIASYGREFSPRYGGGFFREIAGHYGSQKSFVMETRGLKEGRIIHRFDAEELARRGQRRVGDQPQKKLTPEDAGRIWSEMGAKVSVLNVKAPGNKVLELVNPGGLGLEFVLPMPPDTPANCFTIECAKLSLPFPKRSPGVKSSFHLSLGADYHPYPLPAFFEAPPSLDFSLGMNLDRNSLVYFLVGQTPAGEAIYENRTELNGQRMFRWRLVRLTESLFRFWMKGVTLRFEEISVREMLDP